MGGMIAVAKITERYMTVAEAMKALPASAASTVIRMVGRGDLEGEQIAGRWLISRKSIDAFREREQAGTKRMGRPRLSPSKKRRA